MVGYRFDGRRRWLFRGCRIWWDLVVSRCSRGVGIFRGGGGLCVFVSGNVRVYVYIEAWVFAYVFMCVYVSVFVLYIYLLGEFA